MNRRLFIIRAGLGAGLLALAGCGAMLDAPPPKTHFDKESVQHMYDTGQISYPVYCQEMQSLDANWTPSSAPPPDKKYGQFVQ